MKELLNEFEHYIHQNNLFTSKDKILLAISGGMDSMVMLHLFSLTKYQIGVAHVNFHLRGEDSNEDFRFVQAEAERLNLPFYSVDFDTEDYAQKTGLSIEMAARQLRYQYFNRICRDFHYQFLATAHHLNDSVETFFLNTLRAGGIQSLAGIHNKRENIVRPLLFLSRKQIESYAVAENIAYRTDISNSDTSILRNKIRHHILPKFEQMMPEYLQQMDKTLQYIKQANAFIKAQMHFIMEHNIKMPSNYTIFNLTDYIDNESLPFILHELWFKEGFSVSQIKQMKESLTNEEYAFFESKNYIIYSGKKQLLWQHKDYFKKRTDEIVFSSLIELMKYFDGQEVNSLEIDYKTLSKFELIVSADRFQYPIKLRNWQVGDYFYPLGLKGKKKISDFLTDLKLDPFEKYNVKVLENANGHIIWIPGYRTDNRFKVTEAQNNLIRLKKSTFTVE